MYIHTFDTNLKINQMKKLIYTATVLLLSTTLFAGGPKGGEYVVNQKTSALEWTGKKVTGQHEGTIAIKEGKINVNDGVIQNGVLIIDMTSIIVTDLEDEGTNAKLKGHLSSDDFFGIQKHPTAILKIIKVESKGGDKYHIHGELTIKGITEKVEIPATIKMEENKLVAIGTAEIDRTKYGIKYGSGSFFDGLGDKAINDLFTVKFKVGAML